MLPSTGLSLGFATKQYCWTRCSPSTVGFGVNARAPREITTRGLALATGSPPTSNWASRRGSILTPRSCGRGRRASPAKEHQNDTLAETSTALWLRRAFPRILAARDLVAPVALGPVPLHQQRSAARPMTSAGSSVVRLRWSEPRPQED